MAKIKKNQMANIIFPIVDGTDFASIESGITASNFDSKVTKKFFGVTHGNSTAFTSGTISKAATLVRSGLIQQTLKAAETNYDYIVYSFAPANTSLAQQILVFEPVDYDDSDLMSRISDVNSDLRSYLVGMSGMLSDVDSQLLLNASMISDVQSNLTVVRSMASDAHSAATLGASRALVIQSLVSDVDSQLLLNASMISDVDSQLTVTDTAMDSQYSDLASKIGGVTASVSASDMSDIASRVWATAEGTRVDSRILVIQSLVSDVDSQLLLNASMISDVDSQLTVTDTAMDSQYSDLASKIGGVTASVSASDISDIASAVWANTIGARVDSRVLVIQSMVSDVDSQLLLNASMISDVDSQLNLNASVISDAHSAAAQANSRALVLQSNLSDVESQLDLTASVVSDIDSQLLLNASMISDIDSQLTVTHSLLSDVESQIDAGVTVGASSISDIASAVWAESVAEPTTVPAANAPHEDKLAWLFTLARNRRTTTATLDSVRNDANDSTIASAVLSDDGTTFVRNEYA